MFFRSSNNSGADKGPKHECAFVGFNKGYLDPFACWHTYGSQRQGGYSEFDRNARGLESGNRN